MLAVLGEIRMASKKEEERMLTSPPWEKVHSGSLSQTVLVWHIGAKAPSTMKNSQTDSKLSAQGCYLSGPWYRKAYSRTDSNQVTTCSGYSRAR
jgi:hypothetical protein